MNKGCFTLGTVQFGMHYGINNRAGKPSLEEAFDILNFAHDKGIIELDSADSYGDAQRVIGDFMQSTNKKFKVNSKFKIGDLTIPQQLNNTLNELKLQQLNVFFYHRFADMIDHPHTLQQLLQLKHDEKICQTGVSIYTNKEFAKAIETEEIDVIQLPFNLLDNTGQRYHLIDRAKNKGKFIQVRSVFLQGLFFRDINTFPEGLRPLSKHVTRLKGLAAEHNLSMMQLALGYVYSKSFIDSIIIGVDSREQIFENMQVENVDFPLSLQEQIDSILVEDEMLLYPANWK